MLSERQLRRVRPVYASQPPLQLVFLLGMENAVLIEALHFLVDESALDPRTLLDFDCVDGGGRRSVQRVADAVTVRAYIERCFSPLPSRLTI